MTFKIPIELGISEICGKFRNRKHVIMRQIYTDLTLCICKQAMTQRNIAELTVGFIIYANY